MMDRGRAFVVCFMTALLTLTVAGCTSSINNNNTSTVSTRTSENVSMTTTTNATNVTHGEPMTAAQGQNFTITLRSNPSTGYHLSLIHISEPTRQAEISYAVFCLKKKKILRAKEYKKIL